MAIVVRYCFALFMRTTEGGRETRGVRGVEGFNFTLNGLGSLAGVGSERKISRRDDAKGRNVLRARVLADDGLRVFVGFLFFCVLFMGNEGRKQRRGSELGCETSL